MSGGSLPQLLGASCIDTCMDTGYTGHMTNTSTAVVTTTGQILLVKVDEDAGTIRFLDDDDRLIAEYTFTVFADLADGLAIDLGRDIAIDAYAVAGLQQFADLDTLGLHYRQA
jgi:hypothetical protein